MKNQPVTMKNHENPPGTRNNFGRGRGGRAGINKNVTYPHGVTTDQGRGGRAGKNKNVTY